MALIYKFQEGNKLKLQSDNTSVVNKKFPKSLAEAKLEGKKSIEAEARIQAEQLVARKNAEAKEAKYQKDLKEGNVPWYQKKVSVVNNTPEEKIGIHGELAKLQTVKNQRSTQEKLDDAALEVMTSIVPELPLLKYVKPASKLIKKTPKLIKKTPKIEPEIVENKLSELYKKFDNKNSFNYKKYKGTDAPYNIPNRTTLNLESVGENTIDGKTIDINNLVNKVNESEQKSKLIHKTSEVPVTRDASVTELRSIADSQEMLRHAEVPASNAEHIVKVNNKYYDTSKLTTEEYDLLEKSALNSSEQLASYHASFIPKETLKEVDRFGKKERLVRTSFVTNPDEAAIDKLLKSQKLQIKYNKGKPQIVGNSEAEMKRIFKEADELGISPDDILKRVLLNSLDANKKGAYLGKPFYLNPKNPQSSTRATIFSNPDYYKAFAKDLNETGSMGGKAIHTNPAIQLRIDQYNEFIKHLPDNDPKKMLFLEKMDKLKKTGIDDFTNEFKNKLSGKEAMSKVSFNKKGGLIYKPH
jgi:hypothetical protein